MAKRYVQKNVDQRQNFGVQLSFVNRHLNLIYIIITVNFICSAVTILEMILRIHLFFLLFLHHSFTDQLSLRIYLYLSFYRTYLIVFPFLSISVSLYLTPHLSLSVSLSLSLSLSLSVSVCLSLSHSLSLSLSLSLSSSLSLSFSLYLSLSINLLSLSFNLHLSFSSLYRCLSISIFLCLSLNIINLSFSLSLFHYIYYFSFVRVWVDARTVNVIASACTSTMNRVVVAALQFFLGELML